MGQAEGRSLPKLPPACEVSAISGSMDDDVKVQADEIVPGEAPKRATRRTIARTGIPDFPSRQGEQVRRYQEYIRLRRRTRRRPD